MELSFFSDDRADVFFGSLSIEMGPKRKSPSSLPDTDEQSPLWKPKTAGVIPVSTQSTITEQITKRVNAVSFQKALIEKDVKTALIPRDMDNSESHFEDKNPMVAWATIPWPEYDAAIENYQTYRGPDYDGWVKYPGFLDCLSLFRNLMNTGAAWMLNEIDSNGDRPIDVASSAAFDVLMHTRNISSVQFKSTQKNSPLHRVMRTFSFITVSDIIQNYVDQSELWWENPNTQQTALGLACTLTHTSKLKIVDYLLTFVDRSVNPYHPCLDNKKITTDPDIMARLRIGRRAWSDYRRVHLPTQIASALRNTPPPLIELISDYAIS